MGLVASISVSFVVGSVASVVVRVCVCIDERNTRVIANDVARVGVCNDVCTFECALDHIDVANVLMLLLMIHLMYFLLRII